MKWYEAVLTGGAIVGIYSLLQSGEVETGGDAPDKARHGGQDKAQQFVCPVPVRPQ